MSSRLFQRIREERGLSYSIYSYLSSHSDAGALVVYCGTVAGVAEQVLELTINEIDTLEHGELSLAEVEMAREQIKGNILLSLESSKNRMSRLTRNEIYHGYQPALESIVEKIDQVDVDAVIELAKRIFTPQSYTLQAVGRVRDLKPDSCLFKTT